VDGAKPQPLEIQVHHCKGEYVLGSKIPIHARHSAVYSAWRHAHITVCAMTEFAAMRFIRTGLLYFFAFGVAGYAVFAYSVLPLGALVHPDMKANFLAHSAGIYTHIFAASLALLLGPLQFSAPLRQKYTNIHRWFGRIYLTAGVLVGGLAGLYLSQFAFGGPVARLGFAALAICWMYTGLRAYLAIRRGATAEHRKWMIRNFALTFAAVTLRFYLPVSMAANIEFTLAYPVIAWLCWVPNLLFVEWQYNTTRQRRPASEHTR
jgi:uncharacterized membrane protein